MPTYPIECSECGTKADKRLSFSDYDLVKSGSKTIACAACGQPANLGFAPGAVGFILKEGPSGGWASKSIKENDYRKKRVGVMQRRQKDHVRTSKLQPNYKGEETGTWKEAREEVRREKGDIAASTYDPLVVKERVIK